MQYTNARGDHAAIGRTDARANPGWRVPAVSTKGIYPRQHGRNRRSDQVTKRTLYYHFESKDALLAAVLETQHRLALAAFRTFGDQLAGSPQKIVDAMFRDLAVWADTPRWAGSGFTRLVVELADLPGHPARLIARRHKAMLEEHFAVVLRKAGVARARERARAIWLLSEGAISLMLVHNDRRYVQAAATAAKQLLRSRSG